MLQAGDGLPPVLRPRRFQESKPLGGGQQVEARTFLFRVVTPKVVGFEGRGGLRFVQPADGVTQLTRFRRGQPVLGVQRFLKFRERRGIAVDAEQEGPPVGIFAKPLEQHLQHTRVADLQGGQQKGEFGPILGPEFLIEREQRAESLSPQPAERIQKILLYVVGIAADDFDKKRKGLGARPKTKQRDEVVLQRDGGLALFDTGPHQFRQKLLEAVEDCPEEALVDADAAVQGRPQHHGRS